MNTKLTIFRQYCDEVENEIPFRSKALIWCAVLIVFVLTAYFLGWVYTPFTMLIFASFFGIARTKKVD